ncbi:pyridoxal kinase isoform X2 [Tanacetum coccineum]
MLVVQLGLTFWRGKLNELAAMAGGFWEVAANAAVVEADAFKDTNVIYQALSSKSHHNDMLQTAEMLYMLLQEWQRFLMNVAVGTEVAIATLQQRRFIGCVFTQDTQTQRVGSRCVEAQGWIYMTLKLEAGVVKAASIHVGSHLKMVGRLLRSQLSVPTIAYIPYDQNWCYGSAVFPLQLLGYGVDPIMSAQFSNHTGYPTFKGQVLNGKQLWEF